MVPQVKAPSRVSQSQLIHRVSSTKKTEDIPKKTPRDTRGFLLYAYGIKLYVDEDIFTRVVNRWFGALPPFFWVAILVILVAAIDALFGAFSANANVSQKAF